MRKNKIDRDIVVVLIMTLVTISAWIGFEVFRAYTHKNIPPVLSRQLKELSPILDLNTLGKLEGRTP